MQKLSNTENHVSMKSDCLHINDKATKFSQEYKIDSIK